ncbi:MAG: hypothetical protein AAB680_05015 [Pseudomonadota bacterium]
MDRLRRIGALFFGISGSIAVLLFALARHSAPIWRRELYEVAGQQMLFHSFLGLLICALWDRFGRFYFVPIMFCAVGILLFCLPIVLRINGVIETSPTAPFGGLAFNLAWLSAGISIFIGQKRSD